MPRSATPPEGGQKGLGEVGEADTAALGARLGTVEREVENLRRRDHVRAGEVAALRTLAEVANEQRGQIIGDVATLRAEVRHGFGRRDRFARWVFGLALTVGIATAAAIVERV